MLKDGKVRTLTVGLKSIREYLGENEPANIYLQRVSFNAGQGKKSRQAQHSMHWADKRELCMLANLRKVCPFGYMYAGALLSIFMSCSLGAAASDRQTPPQKILNVQDAPQTILTTCASYARGLVPEERAFLMVRIATVASSNHFPQSTTWARQAFLTSSDLPESWNKIALQKNALIALAGTLPMEALRLLGTLSAPVSENDARLDEDPRADAARVIFESAYRKGPKKSLLPMLEVSSYLGRSGQYPYAAWGILLPKIAKEHPSTFDEVIATAVYFYANAEDRTRIQGDDYFEMVNAIRTVADRSQMKMTVAAGIDHLQSAKTPKNETYLAVVGQGAQKTAFDDRSKALLYKWLPLVKEFDSADYEDLAQRLNVSGAPKATQSAAVEILGDPKTITPSSDGLATI